MVIEFLSKITDTLYNQFKETIPLSQKSLFKNILDEVANSSKKFNSEYLLKKE